MILSVFVAMILTPALCSTLLKPVAKGHTPGECGWFCQFFNWFNKLFDFCRGKYEGIVGRSFGKPVRYLVVYGTIVAAMVFFFYCEDEEETMTTPRKKKKAKRRSPSLSKNYF